MMPKDFSSVRKGDNLTKDSFQKIQKIAKHCRCCSWSKEELIDWLFSKAPEDKISFKDKIQLSFPLFKYIEESAGWESSASSRNVMHVSLEKDMLLDLEGAREDEKSFPFKRDPRLPDFLPYWNGEGVFTKVVVRNISYKEYKEDFMKEMVSVGFVFCKDRILRECVVRSQDVVKVQTNNLGKKPKLEVWSEAEAVPLLKIVVSHIIEKEQSPPSR